MAVILKILISVTYLFNMNKVCSKIPIDRLNNNIVEMLKVSSIKRSFHNRIYEINPQNADFGDLPFDGDHMLIAKLLIYRINNAIIFRLNNGSIIYI